MKYREKPFRPTPFRPGPMRHIRKQPVQVRIADGDQGLSQPLILCCPSCCSFDGLKGRSSPSPSHLPGQRISPLLHNSAKLLLHAIKTYTQLVMMERFPQPLGIPQEEMVLLLWPNPHILKKNCCFQSLLLAASRNISDQQTSIN